MIKRMCGERKEEVLEEGSYRRSERHTHTGVNEEEEKMIFN